MLFRILKKVAEETILNLLNLNKKTGNKIFQLVFSLILVAVLLTSCINVAPLTTTTTTGISGALKSGALNLEDSGPITLDPAAAYEITSASYIMQLFSGLVSLRLAGHREDHQRCGQAAPTG